MDWDLGVRGFALLLAMSVGFGLAAHLVAGRSVTRWLGAIAGTVFLASGLFISEVLFGWATEEDLQPNIDGLSRDEALLAVFPGILAVWLVRRMVMRRQGSGSARRPSHLRTGPPTPHPS